MGLLHKKKVRRTENVSRTDYTNKVTPFFNIKMDWVTEITHVRTTASLWINSASGNRHSGIISIKFQSGIDGGYCALPLTSGLLATLRIIRKLESIFSNRFAKLETLFNQKEI